MTSALLLPIRFKEGVISPSPTNTTKRNISKGSTGAHESTLSVSPDAPLIRTWKTCQQLAELIEDGERFAYGSWRQWSITSSRRLKNKSKQHKHNVNRETTGSQMVPGLVEPSAVSVPHLHAAASSAIASSPQAGPSNRKKRPASHLVECDCGMDLPGSAIAFVETPKGYLSPPSEGAMHNASTDMFGEPSSSVFATANGRSMSDLDLEQWLSMPLDFGASTPQASANDAGHSMFGMTSMSPKSGLNSTPAPSLAVHPFQSPSLPGAGEVRKSSVSRGKARAIPVTCGRVGGCGAEDCCLSGLVGSVGKSPSSTSARSLANQQQQKPPASGVPSSQMQGIVTLEDIAAITMGASAFSSGDSGNHPTLTANPPSTSHMSPLQATPASSCASSSLQLVLPSGSRAPEESALARIIPGLFPVTTASSFEHMYRTPSLQDSPMSFAPGPGSTAHSSPAPSMLGAGSTSSPATTAPPSKIDPDRPQCSNCEAFRTPLWRRDPENRLLCNACGLYQKLHKRSRPKVLKSAFQHHPDCVAPISHPCQSQGCKLDADENPTLCANCGTSTTPLWRKDEQGNPNCNACGLWRSLHGTARPVRMRMDHIRKRQRAEDKRPRKASGYQMESGRSAEDSGGMPSPAAIQQQQTPIATPGVGTPNTTSFTFSQPSTPLPGSPLAHQYPQQPQQQQQPHVVPSSTSTTDSLAGLAAMSSGIPIIAHPTPHGIALQCPHTGQAWFFPNGGAGGAVPSQQPPQQQQMQQQQKSPEEARSPGSELSNMFGNSNMEMPVFGPSAATVTHSPWDTPAAAATPAHAPTSMTAEEGEMLTSMQRGLTATTSASTMMDVDLEDDASKSLQGAFSQVRRGGAATASGKKAGDEEEDGKQQQQQGNKGRKLWWTTVA